MSCWHWMLRVHWTQYRSGFQKLKQKRSGHAATLHDQIVTVQTALPCLAVLVVATEVLLKLCELWAFFFFFLLEAFWIWICIGWFFRMLLLSFGIQISHAFCTTAINEHTQFTFIYSSCDWMKWKAAANEHQEDILVTGSEWHCTWPRCLFSFSFNVLHCIVNITLFVPVKNWWVFLTQKSNRNPPPPSKTNV